METTVKFRIKIQAQILWLSKKTMKAILWKDNYNSPIIKQLKEKLCMDFLLLIMQIYWKLTLPEKKG